MRAEGAAADVERIAGLAGARGMTVVHVGDTLVAGVPRKCIDVECRDNQETIDLLNLLAEDDAKHGAVTKAFAGAIGRWATRAAGLGGNLAAADGLYARECHRVVRDQITYSDDTSQVLRSSDVTLQRGSGNCVNSARLIASLCHVRGIPAEAVPFEIYPDEGITHTATRIWHDGAWHWAEATIPAEYGEHPIAAAHRLGVLL
jgi:hypothetical protein